MCRSPRSFVMIPALLQEDVTALHHFGDSMLSESNGIQFCKKPDFLVTTMREPGFAQGILDVSDTTVYNKDVQLITRL
eukprot:m.80757 g.80757  ORF g.80757 m.80757 type:complete len:78 (+) comp16313_c0_seq2:988-1221(+)